MAVDICGLKSICLLVWLLRGLPLLLESELYYFLDDCLKWGVFGLYGPVFKVEPEYSRAMSTFFELLTIMVEQALIANHLVVSMSPTASSELSPNCASFASTANGGDE